MKRALLVFIPAIFGAVYGKAQTITTIAGTPPGGIVFIGDGGPASAAKLMGASGVVTDAAGNVYIADAGNHRVRKINTSGVISTIAGTGTPGFSGDGGAATAANMLTPCGICIDAAGNLYVAELSNGRVRKISTSGIISTVAGNGTLGFSGDGGPATAAKLNQPSDVAIDASGKLYIADKANHCIRMVNTSGVITTIAGTTTAAYSGDGGPASVAELNNPTGIHVDAAGNIYIADHTNGRVRKIAGGTITTIAGTGTLGYSGDGGPATGAALWQPYDMCTDVAGNVYITDMVNKRVRMVNVSGTISTIGGNGTAGFSGDGGLATVAQIDNPSGIYMNATGNIYFADQLNNRIRVLYAGGTINSIAGTSRYIGDGGPATNAELLTPECVAADKHGNVYFSEVNGHRVRKISAAGVISTYAGTGNEGFTMDGAMATSANMIRPEGIALDTAGSLYFVDDLTRMRKVDVSGILTTVAGNGASSYTGDGGPAISASLIAQGVATDTNNNIYLSCSGQGRIRKINAAGTITLFAGTGTLDYGGDGAPATNADLNYPHGMSMDDAGNFYFADQTNNVIRKITPAGDIFTVGGNTVVGYSGDGGPATAAELHWPYGVVVMGGGNVIFSDGWNHVVRMIDTDGVISTIVGNGTSGHSGDGGPATAASMWHPTGLAAGADDNTLYIVDFGAAVVRKVSNVFGTPPTVKVDRPWKQVRTELFPNPVVDEVRLYANTVITHVTISNMLGQQVVEQQYNNKNVTVDVAHLPPDLYLIRINDSETQKFVKE